MIRLVIFLCKLIKLLIIQPLGKAVYYGLIIILGIPLGIIMIIGNFFKRDN